MHRFLAIRAGIAVALLLGAFATTGAAAPAMADTSTPLFVDWTSLLPSLSDAFDPNSANDCVAGRPRCVDVTIKEMQRRFDPLASSCDHNSVFSMAYLRTTQTYKWARNQTGFFNDTPLVNHEDAVFARYYFSAFDKWASGNRSAVPESWLIALDAAKERQVTGTGNLLLGMSAHVNRDLPFVLDAISITYPDGTTRKPDHDKVNQFLNAEIAQLLAEASTRFDPGIYNMATPYGVGYTGFFQLLQVWREQAWRNAEALTNAATPADRAAVADQIETAAADEARSLVAENAYTPPLTSSASRDAYCGVHNGDAAPQPYPFGQPSPW